MPKKVLVDSGYWIALFNARDEHHHVAKILAEDLSAHTLLVPWPTLFECVGTRLVRRRDAARRFKCFLLHRNTVLLDDTPYRLASLEFIFGATAHTYSLTDQILRSMLEDRKLFIDAFAGFNPDDFYDVCAIRGVEMLYKH